MNTQLVKSVGWANCWPTVGTFLMLLPIPSVPAPLRTDLKRVDTPLDELCVTLILASQDVASCFAAHGLLNVLNLRGYQWFLVKPRKIRKKTLVRDVFLSISSDTNLREPHEPIDL